MEVKVALCVRNDSEQELREARPTSIPLRNLRERKSLARLMSVTTPLRRPSLLAPLPP